MKTLALALIAMLFAVANPADAERNNPYGIAIRVNDKVITNFEIDQRVILLRAFGTAGDLKKTAEKQLIEDRLRLQAGKQAGVVVTPEEIAAGVDEFASRGNITGAQLYQYIAQRGASKESMDDFVRAGLMWRNLVQARFGARSAVSENEIDTTLNLISVRPQQEVLIAEIQIPLSQQGDDKALELAKSLSKSINSEGAFASAARRYSRAPSRGRSGRLDWIPIDNLPTQIVGPVMALQPGEVTAPITLGATVGLFQLRGVRDQKAAPKPVSVSYVSVNVPGVPGSKEVLASAVKLINDVDTCADLRARSERFAKPGHEDHNEALGEVPSVVALVLADLDRNEASYYTNSAGTLTVVMLCDRLVELPEGARDNIRNGLFSQRIGGLGEGYLQELLGDAVVTYK